MSMDPDLVGQLTTAHSRDILNGAGVAQITNQAMAQLSLQISSSNEYDRRLLNGYLADQLFEQGVIQSKTAFHTPVEPSASPLPSAQAKS